MPMPNHCQLCDKPTANKSMICDFCEELDEGLDEPFAPAYKLTEIDEEFLDLDLDLDLG